MQARTCPVGNAKRKFQKFGEKFNSDFPLESHFRFPSNTPTKYTKNNKWKTTVLKTSQQDTWTAIAIKQTNSTNSLWSRYS